MDQRLERMAKAKGAERQENQPGNNPDEDPSWSLLSIIYALLVAAGSFFGFACAISVFLKKPLFTAATHLSSLGFGGLAFLVLGGQMIIHFPIERQFDKKFAEEGERNQRLRKLAQEQQELFKRQPPWGAQPFERNAWDQQLAQNQKAMDMERLQRQQGIVEIAPLIAFNYSFWLWLSCILTFLSGPVFLLEAGISVRRLFKNNGSVPKDSGHVESRQNQAASAAPTNQTPGSAVTAPNSAPRAEKPLVDLERTSWAGTKTRWGIILTGGVLLLLMCCTGGGIGSYFLFFNPRTIEGKWQSNIADGVDKQKIILEFDSGGKGRIKTNQRKPAPKGKTALPFEKVTIHFEYRVTKGDPAVLELNVSHVEDALGNIIHREEGQKWRAFEMKLDGDTMTLTDRDGEVGKIFDKTVFNRIK